MCSVTHIAIDFSADIEHLIISENSVERHCLGKFIPNNFS